MKRCKVHAIGPITNVMSRFYVIDSDPVCRQALEGLVKNIGSPVQCQASVSPQAQQQPGDVYVVLGARGEKAPSVIDGVHVSMIPKPVRAGEVLEALRRFDRPAGQGSADLVIGAYELNTLLHELKDTASGRILRLTEKESRVLSLLAGAGHGGLPRLALMQAVWGYDESIETHTLETHIYRLRQKLEGENFSIVLLTHADGYALAVQ